MNKENKNNVINKIIDWLSLSILGAFCYIYSLFFPEFTFAELNIKLPFLNFPIFIGEILLGICIAFFIIKYMTNQIPFERWHCLLLAYIAFILIKASWGYLKWGPMALRHAALFYYPLFAVVGYYLVERSLLISNNARYALKVLLLLYVTIFLNRVLYVSLVPGYFLYTYLILIFLLILEIKHRLLRYTAFLLLAIIFPFKLLVIVPRAVLVAEAVALLFLIVSLFFIIRVRMKYKVLFSLALLSIFAFFVYSFTRKTDIKSLIFPRITLNQYRRFARVIEATKDKVKLWGYIPAQIYEDDIEFRRRSVSSPSYKLPRADKEIGKTSPKFASQPAPKMATERRPPQPLPKEEVETPKMATERRPPQPLPKEEVETIEKTKSEFSGCDFNIAWRMFVWRDMLAELLAKKANIIWGIDFGNPFRSRSVEILGWDSGLGRVGWLEPHNSYLHILYRSGVIGFLFIVFVWGLFIKMSYSFIKSKDAKGILLSSALLVWLVDATFGVIFELPYFAIPFWSLFGVSLAYCYRQIKC